MGFDLIAVAPVSADGENFHNTCWGWRPLWQFIIEKCPGILTDKQIEMGEYNDGVLVDESQCSEIAVRLERMLAKGEVKKYEKEYKKFQLEVPDEVCKFCHGTGKRNDKHLVGKCNVCRGSGKVRPFVCSYPFEESNVRGFVAFLNNCGGFEIW